MWGQRPGQPDASLSSLGPPERRGSNSGYVPSGGARSGPRRAARGRGPGKQMEFVLIGRGERVAPRLRQVTEHKLGRLERIEPRITRLEVEVINEKNPRRGGLHRIEAVAAGPRKSYRAHAEAKDVESALD